MLSKTEIQPRKRQRVYDVVRDAGFDVSDWANYKGRSPAANPKYCYEWTFVDHGRLVLKTLWYDEIEEENGQLVAHLTYPPPKGTKPVQVRRSLEGEAALREAVADDLPLRVIVVAGKWQKPGSKKPSVVKHRILDEAFWSITQVGPREFTLTRGTTMHFVDQFSVDDSDDDTPPHKKTVNGEVYDRSRKVRESVLERAQGICELCGEQGFRTVRGAIYLETHHIVPLHKDGRDKASNMAALCPNDHRRADHGEDRDSIRAVLLAKITGVTNNTKLV